MGQKVPEVSFFSFIKISILIILNDYEVLRQNRE